MNHFLHILFVPMEKVILGSFNLTLHHFQEDVIIALNIIFRLTMQSEYKFYVRHLNNNPRGHIGYANLNNINHNSENASTQVSIFHSKCFLRKTKLKKTRNFQ